MNREIDSLDRIASVLRSRKNQALLSRILDECEKVHFTWQMDSPKHYNDWGTPEAIGHWSKAMETGLNALLNVNAKMPVVEIKIPANPLNFVVGRPGVYDTEKKQITLNTLNSSFRSIETLAHEYCHFIQDIKEYDWFSNDPLYDSTLCEGFAEAAAIAAIGDYADKSGNLMMKCDALKSAQEHMQRCRNYCLDNMPLSGVHYDVGATAFILAEAKHGKGIYEKVLKSKDPAGALVDLLGGRK